MSFNISAKVNNLSVSTRNIITDLTDTQSEVSLIFSDYVTNAALSTSLASYATVADANASLALKSNITNVESSLDLKADKATTYTKTETDTSLALKSNITYVDTNLALKADKTTTYTKTETDTSLALKSNITYVDTNLALKANLAYVDTNLALKADKATTYTKTETDTSLALKSNLTYVDASLALKSNITYVDTNLALKADKTSTYTKTDIDTSLGLKANITYVDSAVSRLVGAAPGTLDTLNELALALGNDANFSTTVSTLIGTKSPLNNPTFTGVVAGITASMVGLGNVNNTSDLNKPISTAVQTALNLYQPLISAAISLTLNNISANNVTVTGALSGAGVTALLSSYQLVSSMSNYLTSTTAYNKTEVDGRIATVIAGLTAYQTLLTSSSSIAIGTLSVNNAIAGIDNDGLVYGRSISLFTSDIWHTFYVNETNGFRYQYARLILPTTIVKSVVQSNSTGTLISFNSYNVTINSNGVSSTPLTITTPDTTPALTIKNSLNNPIFVIDSIGNTGISGNLVVNGNISTTGGNSSNNFGGSGGFSYFYDNALTGTSRILTDFSAGVGYVNIGVSSGGNTGSIAVRPTLVRTSPLEIATPNTTNPLTIKNSANTVVCTISNTGDISTNGSITSNGSAVLTSATIYTKSEVDAKILLGLLTCQPLLTSSTAITGSTLSLAGNITNTNTSGVTISSSGNQILLQQTGDTYGTSSLSLANRNSQNGALLSTTNATITLTDLVMQTSVANSARNIRLESRTGSCTTGQHSLQFGVAGSVSFSVGDSYSNVNRLYIGTQSPVNTTPTDLLTVNGTVALMSGASVTGSITATGSVTSSNLLGPSMQLSSGGHALYFNSNDCFSYSYDNGLTGNSRIYSMLSGAPEGQYLSATGGGSVGSITIRPTYVSTTPLIISAFNTTIAPLTIKTSSTNTILTVAQNGSTSIAGTLNTTGTIEVTNQGGIDNTGLVYGKSFYVNMNPTILDTNNFFRVDKETGIKYQYYKYTQATNTTVTSIIRADISGTGMSYGNNNIIVDQNGVSCTPLTINCPALLSPLLIKNASNVSLCTIDSIGSMVLAGNITTSGNISCTGAASSTNLGGFGGFSYFYDNALADTSRILTDYSAGPGYVNMAVVSGGNTGSIAIRPTYVRTSALEVLPNATSNPLTLKNSSNVAVCTFSNTGGIAASGTITSGGNTVLTTTYNPIFCGGFVSSTGVKGTSIGRINYSVALGSTGKYTITYDSAYGSNNYIPTITPWIASGNSASYGNAGPTTNSTKLEVHTYTSNALANINFYFMVY